MTELLNGTAVRHVRAPGKGGVCLKKGCALYLLCLAAVILVLFPGAAPAEKAAGTVEELESYFLRCRENRRERFTVTCSDALLKQLQADEFHALFRLFGASGMQVPSVSWSSRGELIFERVVYDPEIHYADVPSDPEQVRDCLRQFVDEGAAYFSLTGESSFIGDLFQGRLLRILSGLGMEVRGLTGNPEAGYLRVSSMAPFDAPFSCVEDIYYAASAMSGYRDRGEGTFYLVFDEAAFSALTERDRRIMEFLGGVESAVRYVNEAACLYRYEDVIWQDVPSMLCSTDEEIIGAMRHAGSDSFRIMLSQPLWEEVSGHAFRHLFELEGQAGMKSGQFSVMEEDHILMFEDVQVVSDAVGIEEPSRIREVLTACAQRGDRECTMFRAPELYTLIMKGDG